MKRNSLTALAAATAVAALVAAARPASAQLPACSASLPATVSLVSPLSNASDVPTNFKTIYIQMPAAALTDGPPLSAERVVLVDDAGFVTQGGALHPASPDDIPNLPALGGNTTVPLGQAVAMTWVPALRGGTRYTVQLTPVENGGCALATLATFTTSTVPY